MSTYPKNSEIMSCGGKQKKEDQHGPGSKVDSERKVTMFPLVSGSWNKVPIVKEGCKRGGLVPGNGWGWEERSRGEYN